MTQLQTAPCEKGGRIRKIAIGVGGAGLGVFLIYAIANGGAEKADVPVAANPEPAASQTGSVEKVQGEENAATVASPSDARFQAPTRRVELPHPEMLRAVVKPVRKEVAASHAGVQRFDRCLPICDTRDPLIAGLPEEKRSAPPAVLVAEAPPVPEPEPFLSDSSMIRGSRALLGRATDVSGAVLNGGKQALRLAVDTVW